MELRKLAYVVLAGCMETGLTGEGRGLSPNGSEGSGGGGDVRDTSPRPEVCNGLDDDLDGRIDEDFFDVDGDGVADCRDEDCDVRHLPEGTTTQDPGCGRDLGGDPFDVHVEWGWRRAATVATPVVAHLDDDDGDGVIGSEGDVPEIVVSAYSTGEIVALRGDGSGEVWRSAGFRADTGVAVADVDGDGSPEVVGLTREQQVRALRADGSIAWTSEGTFSLMYPVPTVADLDADGLPEVIADVAVVDGADGRRRVELDLGQAGPWRAPVVADLDLDGSKEILLGGVVYDARGRRRWSALRDAGAVSAFAAVVQADTDPAGEVVWAVGSTVTLHEPDGSVVRSWRVGGGNRPGPPCAGDLDGDGTMEVVVPSSRVLTAFYLDGPVMWSTPVQDASGASGCALYDVDEDGRFEVMYGDMDAFLVLDGATGEVRYRDPNHASVTYFETPAVADVDGDGSAEIVVAASGPDGAVGVTVYGQVDGLWPSAGSSWPVHDFQVDAVGLGGGVPSRPAPSWERWGLFRGRPASEEPRRPDLEAEIVDVCVASCAPGGLMRVAWRVHNRGRAASEEVAVGLELVEEYGSRPYLRGTVGALGPGRVSATGTFDLPWSRVPVGGFRVVADPDGEVIECDEADNAAGWDDRVCAQ